MIHDQTLYEISVSNLNAHTQISVLPKNPAPMPPMNIQVLSKANQMQLRDTAWVFLQQLLEKKVKLNTKFRFTSLICQLFNDS